MIPQFVNDRHLGGYVKTSTEYPRGDWWTWCPQVWDWAILTFKPLTMLDIGCGEGHALRYFLDHCVEAIGVDGVPQVREAGIVPGNRILLHDFTTGPLAPEGQVWDLIWSCEFVEHIEERYLENFLTAFDLARKAVLMTHATPGQPGHHHVNCQPSEYWIERMQARGFTYDHELTLISRALALYTHWQRSGLVFVR